MRQVIVAIVIIAWWSCSKGGGSNTPPDTPPPPSPPEKAALQQPAKDAVCITGEIRSAEQSNVLFDWKDASHASSYELTLKNLLTGLSSKHAATKSELTLLLQRGAPYSWSVTSLSAASSQTAQSEVWKFYNAGEAKQYYAPFPAEVTYPVMHQAATLTNGKITLKWTGSDVDNDIRSYDLYFGKTSTPPFLGSVLVNNTTYEAEATANGDYYWKIITKDNNGNTSESGLFHFKVN